MLTSILMPSLIGIGIWSFKGVSSSPVATLEVSLFRGGIVYMEIRFEVKNWYCDSVCQGGEFVVGRLGFSKAVKRG